MPWSRVGRISATTAQGLELFVQFLILCVGAFVSLAKGRRLFVRFLYARVDYFMRVRELELLDLRMLGWNEGESPRNIAGQKRVHV